MGGRGTHTRTHQPRPINKGENRISAHTAEFTLSNLLRLSLAAVHKAVVSYLLPLLSMLFIVRMILGSIPK